MSEGEPLDRDFITAAGKGNFWSSVSISPVSCMSISRDPRPGSPALPRAYPWKPRGRPSNGIGGKSCHPDEFCMDIWMDGWMDGWMDRWMDGWMDR